MFQCFDQASADGPLRSKKAWQRQWNITAETYTFDFHSDDSSFMTYKYESEKSKPSRNLETKIISRFKNNSNNQTLNITYQWRNYHYVIVATSQTFLLLICLPWSALVLPVDFRLYFLFIWPHASQHIPTNLTIFDYLVTDSLVITFSVALLKPLVTSKTVTIVTSLSQLSVSSDADSSSKQCIFNKISDI